MKELTIIGVGVFLFCAFIAIPIYLEKIANALGEIAEEFKKFNERDEVRDIQSRR